MSDSKDTAVTIAQERMRYRDLVLQVKRFLKFAPKGTSNEVLILEAKEFDRRLNAIGPRFDIGETRKLSSKLRSIYEPGG